MAQLLKNPPAMRETWVQSLGWEDHSGLENSMNCIVHGVTKSLTQLSDFHVHFLLYGNSEWSGTKDAFQVRQAEFTSCNRKRVNFDSSMLDLFL